MVSLVVLMIWFQDAEFHHHKYLEPFTRTFAMLDSASIWTFGHPVTLIYSSRNGQSSAIVDFYWFFLSVLMPS